jgi:hypothetical protein
MANTTNFNWETPDDTDLVKDGAAAIRTLGSSIDTSFVDLKGGTTGQILSKASNTDLDYTWIANDQGDITEVSAGTGISVASGTGPVPVVTNTVATTFDAKGDLVVGTGADTFAKLTVGTNGHTLVADSAETTGLKWAAPAAAATFIGCQVTSDTNPSLSNNTQTALAWNVERYDTDAFHSNSTNNSRMTIPSGKAGKYLVTAVAEFDNNATGLRQLSIYKNGSATVTTYLTPSTTYPSAMITSVLDLAVNDYVEIYARQTSGTSQTIYIEQSGNTGEFSIAFLGA